MQRPPSFTLFPYTTLFRSSPCFFHFVVILYLITFARFFESLKNESLIRDVALRHFGFAQCRQAQCKLHHTKIPKEIARCAQSIAHKQNINRDVALRPGSVYTALREDLDKKLPIVFNR